MDDQPHVTVDGEQVTDPPEPTLEEIEQRDVPGYPAVDVCVYGPVQVHRLPAKSSAVVTMDLTTTPVRVFGYDPKRARMIVCADAAWRYLKSPLGLGALFPANVPVTFENADQFYARSASGTAVLSIVVENWA